MFGRRVLALAKASVSHTANAICQFSCGSPSSENGAYLSPFNPPPMPTIDKGLPYDHYSEAVRRLRPLFPPTCTFLEAGDVKEVGNVPTCAGGSADIWEVTIGGRRFFQKSYRCYETCNVEHIFQRYLGEVQIHNQLSHPNVVRFFGVNPTTNHPFSLLLDTAGHIGLKEYLRKNPKADSLKLVLGIARGLRHMHDQGVIHGHLASNVLVGPDGTPRITGFGSSRIASCQNSWPEWAGADFHRGSAPELVRPHQPGKPPARITKASDMYAFGILSWEIFSRKSPFSEDLHATVIRRVLDGARPSRPDHDGLSDRVWKMIRECWLDAPPRRIKIGEAVALIEAE